MEYASGGELFTQVANGGAMSEDRARSYFKQIVSAAAHCHSQDICHRDLKLENIILGADEQTVKITDFGLSKDTEQHSQPKTKRVGTISYMAPEVAMASGEIPYSGVAADVWSLGIILYVLVCCEYPFGFDGPGGQPTQRVLARIKEVSHAPHRMSYPAPRLTARVARSSSSATLGRAHNQRCSRLVGICGQI